MKITVWGTGKTGLETAREMLRQGHAVRLVDQQPPAVQSDIPVKILEPEDLEWADIVIPSPGIPQDHPLFSHAKRVLSEIEVASQLMRGKLIAVTGTNGKTTTVTLIHRILETAGKNVGLGGNIAPPLISLVKDDPDYIVAEISSFQLEWIERLRPDIAVCMNVTPDHLDRYSNMEEYVYYKLRIFENQTADNLAIINYDDEWLTARTYEARLDGFSVKAEKLDCPGACIKDNSIFFSDTADGPKIPEINRIGEGVAEDMLAAALVGHHLGIANEVMEKVFMEFKVIHHRFEFVAEIDGITFIDDSKATNVGAVEKALNGINNHAVIILGGVDKGGDFKQVFEASRHKIRKAIILGNQAPRIEEEINGITPIEHAQSMQEAVNKAYNSTEPGDMVLLSPGCASFDLYKSYAHRGEDFVKCVNTILTNRK